MLRVLIVLAIMVAALLRGGDVSNFARLRLRRIPLVLISLLIQLLIFPVAGASPFVAAATIPLYLLSMLLLVWWVWLNRHLPGIVPIGAGVVLNLAAIAANGGHMPIDPDAAAYAGRLALTESGTVLNNSRVAEQGVPLWFLTDIFPIPAGLPFATVYSLGDLLLTAGAAILCYTTMRMGPEDASTTKGATNDQAVPAS